MTAPQRRKGVEFLKEEGFSERRACRLIGLPRSSLRYEARPSDDAALLEQIREEAFRRPRYGYRRVWAMLRRGGLVVNVKRVHRLWKDGGLSRARKRSKRRKSLAGQVPRQATHANHVWTYDFIHDACANGRTLKILTVEDEYTRFGLAIEVETRMRSTRVLEILERVFAEHGAPEFLRSDNGPEFIAGVLRRWITGHGADTQYIDPGSPWQNAYGESFNGRFRDECLNAEVFSNLAEAKVVTEGWRVDYNERRPHSSLGYLTPAEFRNGTAEVGALPPHPRSLPHSAQQDAGNRTTRSTATATTRTAPKEKAERNAPPIPLGSTAALGSLSSVALSSARTAERVP